jgi:hypothetical protein
MKGSLTATSSTSGHWSATLATSLPIRPKPAAPSKNLPSEINPEKQQTRSGQIGGAELTVDADLDGSCAEHGDPSIQQREKQQ